MAAEEIGIATRRTVDENQAAVIARSDPAGSELALVPGASHAADGVPQVHQDHGEAAGVLVSRDRHRRAAHVVDDGLELGAAAIDQEHGSQPDCDEDCETGDR